MDEVRLYGIVCPICRKTTAIGKVRLQPNAQLADLRKAVCQAGWKPDEVFCEHKGCDTKIVPVLDHLIFLDLKADR